MDHSLWHQLQEEHAQHVREQLALRISPEQGAARQESITHGVLVSTNMIRIDESRCVHCSNCEDACVAAHDDGISRLQRNGEKSGPFLIGANSCRHCENAPCATVCRTNAIVRDKDSGVRIKLESCISCADCRDACPFNAIQMVRLVQLDREVPVKCDLCNQLPAGPACVASCPTQALVRVSASEAIADFESVLGR